MVLSLIEVTRDQMLFSLRSFESYFINQYSCTEIRLYFSNFSMKFGTIISSSLNRVKIYQPPISGYAIFSSKLIFVHVREHYFLSSPSYYATNRIMSTQINCRCFQLKRRRWCNNVVVRIIACSLQLPPYGDLV